VPRLEEALRVKLKFLRSHETFTVDPAAVWLTDVSGDSDDEDLLTASDVIRRSTFALSSSAPASASAAASSSASKAQQEQLARRRLYVSQVAAAASDSKAEASAPRTRAERQQVWPFG
jgi:hypothetical protein